MSLAARFELDDCNRCARVHFGNRHHSKPVVEGFRRILALAFTLLSLLRLLLLSLSKEGSF